MKQKLVLLIALVLALAQGAAAEEAFGLNFTAYLGQQETIIQDFKLTVPEMPLDPDDPVVRSEGNGDSSEMMKFTYYTGNYSLSITGDDSQLFSANIIWTSILMDSNTASVRVNITYSPTTVGSHTATLNIHDSDGSISASYHLTGVATLEPSNLSGDVNGDGAINIADATELVDFILGNPSEIFNVNNADVDGDGMVTVADLTELIDFILGVPTSQVSTYLIATMTDGNIQEYMIDEYSKVKIANTFLVIEISGISMYLELEQVAHLSYDVRVESSQLALKKRLDLLGSVLSQDMQENVLNKNNDAPGTLDKSPIGEPSGEYKNNADSQTLNTLQL